MRRVTKIVLFSILTFFLVLGVTVVALVLHSKNYSIPEQAATIDNKTGLVQSHGRSLYDAAGNQLQLKGVNAGQLLLQEGWMSPFALEPLKNDDGSYVKDKDGNIQYPV